MRKPYKKRKSYYRGRYAISCYTLDDEFVDIWDNIPQIEEKTGIRQNTIRCYFCKRINTLKVYGEKCKLYLIDMKEEEHEKNTEIELHKRERKCNSYS